MVRYGTLDDLSDILEMLKLCKEDMKKRGLHIWDDTYPTADLIKEDIESGNSIVFDDGNHVIAFLVYYPNVVDHNEDLYNDHKNPVLVQRVMSHPSYRRMGHAEAILRYVETLGYSSIRLLTRDVNVYSVNLYMKLGYSVITTAINGTDTMQFCEKVL